MENLCNICPRKCNKNRNSEIGLCKAKSGTVKVAKVMLHYFEEPLISGEDKPNKKANGSGAIFFSNCNLKCVYCQNKEISNGNIGKEITIDALANLFKQLEAKNANNINLVTPTQYSFEIVEALKIYKPKIPIVWNSSGYETAETIEKIKDFVDIYLVDLKYFDDNYSLKYSNAKNYFENASKAILQMRKNQPTDIIQNGLMKKGVIVRHLVLPGLASDSEKVIDWIDKNLSNKTYFSLMSQYVPMGDAKNYPEINRPIKPLEYKILISKLKKLGFDNAFLQDYSSADTCFTPNFEEKDNFDY